MTHLAEFIREQEMSDVPYAHCVETLLLTDVRNDFNLEQSHCDTTPARLLSHAERQYRLHFSLIALMFVRCLSCSHVMCVCVCACVAFHTVVSS